MPYHNKLLEENPDLNNFPFIYDPVNVTLQVDPIFLTGSNIKIPFPGTGIYRPPKIEEE